MARRKFDTNIKSLMHFNYPYFNEPGDGLGDEVSSETWTRQGNAKLVGSDIPADAIVADTPKFGYRCLQTSGNTDYLSCTNNSGIWNAESTDKREVDFWIRPTANSAGNILVLMNDNDAVFTLAKDASNCITLSDGNTTVNTVTTLTLNTWHFIRVSFEDPSAKVIIDGSQEILTFTLNVSVTSARLGGIFGQIDEFCLKHSAEGSLLLGEEYAASLTFSEIGGYGNANHGNVTINSDTVINSYARVVSALGNTITVNSWSNGLIGAPYAGCEVMLHVSDISGTSSIYAGCYAFRTVTAASGTRLTLDSAVTSEFPLTSILSNYVVQVILVPNFNTFTVNAGKKVIPLSYTADTGGGIIALRCKGNMTVNGSILSHGYGPERKDLLQITHAKLIDNFVINRGGGIFIACGSTLYAPSTGRIGASWSGAGTGGIGVVNSVGNPGGAGYGSSGAGDTDSHIGYGGNGGVGGGGGGGDGGTGGDAGFGGHTGGCYLRSDGNRYGGTQGVTPGGNSPHVSSATSGGGGAGGNAGNCYSRWGSGYGGYSGANVIIIADTLNVTNDVISTGGGTARGRGAYGTGGGGAGFCYLACREVL